MPAPQPLAPTAAAADPIALLETCCPVPANDWRPILAAALRAAPGTAEGLVARLAPRLPRLLPPAPAVFAALARTPLARVQVVILGQDPYPTPGDAHGLAFSVARATRPPRSLANLLAEIARSTGAVRTRPELGDWADQGVLLLNSVLTAEAPDAAGAVVPHARWGWEVLTTAVLRAVRAQPAAHVVLAWGRQARDVLAAAGPAAGPHLDLVATHPSPLSCRRAAAGMPAFLGCDHFAQANAFLRAHGRSGIRWGDPA